MKNFLAKLVSTSGDVSFGRVIAGLWAVFYMGQQGWFYHRSGHLIDNATVLTQLSVISALYGLGKFPTAGGNENRA